MSGRGMKKYIPFRSLVAQSECLEEIKYKKNKIERPKITSDKAEEINLLLTELDVNALYKITYFYDGFLYKITTNILGVDINNRRLNTKEGSLYLYDMIDLERV